MREIKFRGWDLVNIVDNVSLSEGRFWFTELDGRRGEFYDFETYPVMQFTGLKDKNGVDIYEGDIVQDGNIKDWRWEVYYDQEEARFWFRNMETSEGVYGQWNASDDPAYPNWKESEVIGNIYENPELLKI